MTRVCAYMRLTVGRGSVSILVEPAVGLRCRALSPKNAYFVSYRAAKLESSENSLLLTQYENKNDKRNYQC